MECPAATVSTARPDKRGKWSLRLFSRRLLIVLDALKNVAGDHFLVVSVTDKSKIGRIVEVPALYQYCRHSGVTQDIDALRTLTEILIDRIAGLHRIQQRRTELRTFG